MDAVTLATANASAKKRPRPSALAAVSGRLKRGTEDVVLGVLGDSTGNDTTEWVYLTTQWLAARYPAYTVTHRLWNDTNQNYDAATTIQTGTGSHALTVYNGSTPVAANNTAGGKKTSLLGLTKLQQFGYGSTFALELSRLGDDALDTYIDPLLLLGIMAVRAS